MKQSEAMLLSRMTEAENRRPNKKGRPQSIVYRPKSEWRQCALGKKRMRRRDWATLACAMSMRISFLTGGAACKKRSRLVPTVPPVVPNS
jgi:hypothetical protein